MKTKPIPVTLDEFDLISMVNPATGVCGLCTYMSPMVAGYVCLKPDRRCSNDHQNRMKLPGTLDGKDVVWYWVADNQE